MEEYKGKKILVIRSKFYEEESSEHYKYVAIIDNKEEQEEVVCCVCDGPCEMNTEYEGSAICKDKNCSVHKEV
ncbi:hypothetical protein LCGC14_2678400 [marine sediment metagenome]|uniref:Uncharacterized protein n=1 Tax=marine sediment metagenome TaxID=412755 RepID=A0A0F8ZM23_9ZZZZ